MLYTSAAETEMDWRHQEGSSREVLKLTSVSSANIQPILHSRVRDLCGVRSGLCMTSILWTVSITWPVQFSSVQSPGRLGYWGDKTQGRSSRDLLPVFSAGGHCEQVWHGQGCPVFRWCPSSLNFLCRPQASSALQSALKDDFGEDVVACDMRTPCEFPSLDSRQKMFLWSHKEVDFVPHAVVGCVL